MKKQIATCVIPFAAFFAAAGCVAQPENPPATTVINKTTPAPNVTVNTPPAPTHTETHTNTTTPDTTVPSTSTTTTTG